MKKAVKFWYIPLTTNLFAFAAGIYNTVKIFITDNLTNNELLNYKAVGGWFYVVGLLLLVIAAILLIVSAVAKKKG
jgi:uncharacterized membrane protein YdbT with pleckstrin-like domain